MSLQKLLDQVLSGRTANPRKLLALRTWTMSGKSLKSLAISVRANLLADSRLAHEQIPAVALLHNTQDCFSPRNYTGHFLSYVEMKHRPGGHF